MKKHFKLLGFVFLLFPLFSCSSSSKSKENNFVKQADDSINITSEKGTLFENKSLYSYTNGPGDYETPTSLHETSSLSNGATDIGYLTVAGSFENDGQKVGVSNNGYTSLKALGNDIVLTYKFHSVNSCDSLKKYKVSDCSSTSFAGYSLGSGRKIGTGVVLLAKMNEGGNWQFVSAWTDLKDGDVTNEYRVGYDDISRGTYYKFFAGYQFQVQDGTVLLFAPTWRGYSVMQEITIRVGIGGAAIKFTVDYTNQNSFNLESKKYEQLNTAVVELSEENKVESYSPLNIYKSTSSQDLGTFKLDGELLRGTNKTTSLEGDVPNYIYNGQTGKVTLNFKNNKGGVNKAVDLATTQINSDYIDSVPFNQILLFNYGGLGTAITPKTGLMILEYKEFLDTSVSRDDLYANYEWKKLDYKAALDTQDYSFTILSSTFNRYSDFRAIYLTAYSINGVNKVLAQTCYFNIIVNNSKFTDSYKLDEDKNVQASIEYNAKANALTEAISLEDGSVCYSTISVYNSESTYTVEVSKDDEPYSKITVFPKEFKETGMYRFRVTNSYGDVNVRTIYLLDIGEDNGRHIFFPSNNNFLVSEEKRMYDANSRIPVYATGSTFSIHSSPYLPGLIGSIYTIDEHGSKNEISSFNNLHSDMNGTFSSPGEYVAVIKTGQDNAYGDQIKYTFHFEIRDPKGYKPTVNYDLLHSGAESFNLMSKTYLVSFQSKGEGKFNFVFPFNDDGYQDALDFAEKIEALDIVLPTENSSTYLYKGKEYSSRIALFADLSKNAESRVSWCFLNKDIIEDNELDYYLTDIQEMSIDKDIFVVSSESIFQYLVTDQVFLNNFIFRQVRDYESSSVTLENVKTKEQFDIKYGVCVNDVLTTSGVYKITETNWNGEPNIYYGSYVKPNDNLTTATVRYSSGARVIEKVVSMSSCANIRSDCFYFKELSDEVDENAIVTISSTLGTSSYLLNELENKVMDMKGTYTIKFSNRLGYSYSFSIVLSGNPGSLGWEPHIDNSNKLAMGGAN